MVRCYNHLMSGRIPNRQRNHITHGVLNSDYSTNLSGKNIINNEETDAVTLPSFVDKKKSILVMSDGASDISDVNTCTSSTSNASASNFSEGLSEQDLLQIEMFFRSHKTDVFVCQCLANLYYGSVANRAGRSSEWVFSLTGVPVLVLNTGEHLRQRKLSIILAEKGTGFVLFKDDIDSLTDYAVPHTNFHTLHLSTDHTKLAGLSFDDSDSAKEFYKTVKDLTSKPDDDLLYLSKKSKKTKKKDGQTKKYKAPKKTEISNPCCFVHVTNLESAQQNPADDLAQVMANQLCLRSSESSDFSDV